MIQIEVKIFNGSRSEAAGRVFIAMIGWLVVPLEAGQHGKLSARFAAHGFTSHGQGEYVDLGDRTNTIEGAFYVVKRGMKGVY